MYLSCDSKTTVLMPNQLLLNLCTFNFTLQYQSNGLQERYLLRLPSIMLVSAIF